MVFAETRRPFRTVKIPRHWGDGLQIDLADADHLGPWEDEWEHMLEIYRERLESPTGECMYGLIDGKLVSHGWFRTGPHYDHQMRYTFDPGEGGTYWFEGWTSQRARGKGIAILGMNWMFADLFSRPDWQWVTHMQTYYEPDNKNSKRLHDRYGFHEIRRMVHYRIGPFRFTRVRWEKPHPDDLKEEQGSLDESVSG